MNSKTILSAFALALALGAASPAFADRYENPEASAVGYQDHGQTSHNEIGLHVNPEGIEPSTLVLSVPAVQPNSAEADSTVLDGLSDRS